MLKFFQNLFIQKRPFFRLVFFLGWDAILIILSVYLAFFVRFEGQIPPRYFLNIEIIVVLALIITIPIFYFLKLYYFSWLYVSTAELISLLKATILSFLVLTALFFIFKDYPIFTGFPRSTLFISYFFIFIFCGGLRFAKRIKEEMFPKKAGGRERTLIVGAGGAGEQILRNILSSKYSPFFPIGFVDDSPSKEGILIHGIKVLGKIDEIPKIVKEKKVESLIVALPSAGVQIIKKAVEYGRQAGIKKIKILPPLSELVNGETKVGIGNLLEVEHEVEMADLLAREPVSLDQKVIDKFIKNKRVLVTGAAGSIGSELCRQIIKFQPQFLFLLDQDETGIFNIENELKAKSSHVISFVADIRDKERMERIFNTVAPQIVFHAAAYKHVPLMEEHSEEAVKNNILGTKILGEAAIKFGTEKVIFVSTDKAVNPTSVMGATKRIGEMVCQSFNNGTKFISVRFGNVLGSRGSVVPIFKEQIEKGGPLTITHENMKRYFMVTSEACLLVMEAGAMGQGGEVFILDMGSPLKILDLAKELIRRSGFEPDHEIRIEYTKPRPGEKFFEEILTAEEGVIATQSQKIFMAKLSKIDENKLKEGLTKLEKAATVGDKETIIKTFKELVPNYGEKI